MVIYSLTYFMFKFRYGGMQNDSARNFYCVTSIALRGNAWPPQITSSSEGWQLQRFAAPCQIADDAMLISVHGAFCPFWTATPKEMSHVTTTVTNMRFVICHNHFICDIFHDRLSADFESRVRLFRDVLP